MKYTKEELTQMLEKKQMSSAILEELLQAREEGAIDFKLIDIREVFEYTNSSIIGTDLLYPTSMVNKFVASFEAMKEEPVVLYCRTGSRTGQIMRALENMGLNNIVHLADGITAYRGETTPRAKIPNEL
jgi:rhodanese-related sulfurtransferase